MMGGHSASRDEINKTNKTVVVTIQKFEELTNQVKALTDSKYNYIEMSRELKKELAEEQKTTSSALGGITAHMGRLTALTKQVENLTTAYNKNQGFIDSLPEKLKKMAEGQTQVTQVTQQGSDANSEYIVEMRKMRESFEDGQSDFQRFKDSMMEVRREIMEVTHVTKGMDKSMFQAASASKVWTAGSRLLSGTGLWSVQNALRGVIDIVSIYQAAQQKKMEMTNKASKAMENYGDAEEKYRVKSLKVTKTLHKEIPQIEAEMMNSRHNLREKAAEHAKQAEANMAKTVDNITRDIFNERIKAKAEHDKTMAKLESRRVVKRGGISKKDAEAAKALLLKNQRQQYNAEEKIRARNENKMIRNAEKLRDKQIQMRKDAEPANFKQIKDKYEEDLISVDKKLKKENLSYKLMRDRGIGQNEALKLLDLELEAMDSLLDKQNKLIFGGQLRKKIRGELAKIEVKVMPKLKKMSKDFFRGGDDPKGGLFGQAERPEREEVKWTKESMKEYEKETGDKPLDFQGKKAKVDSVRVEGRERRKSGMELFTDDFKEKYEDKGIMGILTKKTKEMGMGQHEKGMAMRQQKWVAEKQEGSPDKKTWMGALGLKGKFEDKVKGDKGYSEKTEKRKVFGLGNVKSMTDDMNNQFGAVKKSFGAFADPEKMDALKEKGKKAGKIGKMMGTGKGGFLDKMRSFKPGLLGKALAVITGLPLILKMPALYSKVMGGFKKLIPSLSFVLGKMKTAVMYFFMAIIVVFLVVKVIQMMWGAMADYGDLLKEVGLKGMEIGFRVKALAGTLIDWLGSLWKIVYSAFTGDFDGMIDGLFEFAINTALLAIDLLLLGVSLFFTLAVGIFLGFANWIRKPGHMAKLLKGITSVLLIWGAWMLVKWVVAAVLSYFVGIWGALPVFFVMLGIVIIGGVIILIDELMLLGDTVIKGIIQGFKNVMEGIGDFASSGMNPWGNLEGIPLIHTGGTIGKGGLAVVGEKGPELVNLPGGATVHSNKDSQKMNRGNTNITVNVQGRIGASDRELRDIAKKVGSLINTEINRTTSSSTRGF